MTSGLASTKPAALRRCLLSIMIVLLTVTIAAAEDPLKVTVCQLKNNPPAYNHKLVEVTGFVSHAARNFTVFDPNCPTWPAIWLEYGGTLNSGTVNCCITPSDRHRPRELAIEDIPIPLTGNQSLEDFDKAIQPPFHPGEQGAVEHATLVGRFFAGQRMADLKGHYWGGYGTMGCCSLLAIQEVKDPDTDWRPDLDYGESGQQLDFSPPGCDLRALLPEEQNPALFEAQHDAESGRREWAFTEPARVAADALTRATHVGPEVVAAMKLTHDSPGRKTFEWITSGSAKRYMVAVSRPYWLSFYARDPHRVAWVAVVAYETTCSGKPD